MPLKIPFLSFEIFAHHFSFTQSNWMNACTPACDWNNITRFIVYDLWTFQVHTQNMLISSITHFFQWKFDWIFSFSHSLESKFSFIKNGYSQIQQLHGINWRFTRPHFQFFFCISVIKIKHFNDLSIYSPSIRVVMIIHHTKTK